MLACRNIARVVHPAPAASRRLGSVSFSRFVSTLYHGKRDESMFDVDLQHVLLELPDATSTEDLGSRYVLKFARHFEDDLWHGRYNQVIVRTGSIIRSARTQARVAELELQHCNMTLHDWSTIIPPELMRCDVSRPLVTGELAGDKTVREDPRHAGRPLLATEECLVNLLSQAFLEWAESTSDTSTLTAPTLRLGTTHFSLRACTRESLIAEKAGVYWSGRSVCWLRPGLLSMI
eukprot:TRINITY_DN41094_c0_g1_i1.p1 TRINITY_DN41094_c0_g1~~TRINITY_DN41094_c0_g1_i1.p1  ORF type:complete len:234 (-),score=16.50 TRINITY_DN41094_c0_g1_i1:289-990(-)